MRNLLFTPEAWEDWEYWLDESPENPGTDSRLSTASVYRTRQTGTVETFAFWALVTADYLCRSNGLSSGAEFTGNRNASLPLQIKYPTS